jgi:hypothetical protein
LFRFLLINREKAPEPPRTEGESLLVQRDGSDAGVLQEGASARSAVRLDDTVLVRVELVRVVAGGRDVMSFLVICVPSFILVLPLGNRPLSWLYVYYNI